MMTVGVFVDVITRHRGIDAVDKRRRATNGKRLPFRFIEQPGEIEV